MSASESTYVSTTTGFLSIFLINKTFSMTHSSLYGKVQSLKCVSSKW